MKTGTARPQARPCSRGDWQHSSLLEGKGDEDNQVKSPDQRPSACSSNGK